jgi:hypothetical protein
MSERSRFRKLNIALRVIRIDFDLPAACLSGRGKNAEMRAFRVRLVETTGLLD